MGSVRGEMTTDSEKVDIFQMLSHPYRKRILRLLSLRSRMYTELMEELDIESGKLRFHLEKMRPALSQDDQKRYYLSDFGRQALDVLESVDGVETHHIKKDTKNPRFLVVVLVTGILIGVLIGALIAKFDEDNQIPPPTPPANISEEEKPRFLPVFEIGVFGVPEVLASNESKRARVEIRNIGDVSIINLTLFIKVTPKDNFYISEFEGEGLLFKEYDEGIYTDLGTLYTDPDNMKSFDFTLVSEDSTVDHTIEFEVLFYPRNDWVTVYSKEIFVGPPRIIVR
jgi:DNA-binding transcriptional ArsR family regulator